VVVQDHVSKETVEALFDAMGGLITDASLDVFKRRMGEIVGEDRDAVKDRLVRAYMGGWIDRPNGSVHIHTRRINTTPHPTPTILLLHRPPSP